jgi:hypothetical protein
MGRYSLSPSPIISKPTASSRYRHLLGARLLWVVKNILCALSGSGMLLFLRYRTEMSKPYQLACLPYLT